MAAVSIPPEDVPVLAAIAGLEDSLFSNFLSAFGEAVPSLSKEKFTAQLVERLPKMEKDKIFEILGVLYSLNLILQTNEVSVAELSKVVSQSVLEAKNRGSTFSAKRAEVLEKRLVSLLSFNSLFAVVKARNLKREYERVFCSSRILSDIRPVFSKDATEILGSVIRHSLQIGFHNNVGGKHEEMYFALDEQDLVKLKKTIERWALEKQIGALARY